MSVSTLKMSPHGISLPRHLLMAIYRSDEPSAPRNLRVTSQWTDHMVLEWETPEQDGGKPISNYVIERRDAQRSNWVRSGQVEANVFTYKVGNLFEGAEYYFR